MHCIIEKSKNTFHYYYTMIKLRYLSKGEVKMEKHKNELSEIIATMISVNGVIIAAIITAIIGPIITYSVQQKKSKI